MPRKRNEKEPSSFLSTLSSNPQESSLLLLDAYEHRLREGKTVSPASLEDLRKELDKTPSFEGSLDVTLRLLKLQEKAKAREDASTLSSTRTNDQLTSLRPPSPRIIPKSPRPTKSGYSPNASPDTSEQQWLHQDSPRSTDYSEEDLLQPGFREEEEDEDELARRRSQVRVRRLPSSHSRRRISRQTSRSSRDPASPRNLQFKDQARSVIQPAATSPRDTIQIPGGPTPDYQVQFKDQAQSVLMDNPDVIPVAIAVPIFDDSPPRRSRKPRRHPRSLGYQMMSI